MPFSLCHHRQRSRHYEYLVRYHIKRRVSDCSLPRPAVGLFKGRADTGLFSLVRSLSLTEARWEF